LASSKWRGGPTCASPGSLPACAQKRSSWMQCSAGIASSARRCENICAAGNSSRQHASSQVDPASYGCKLARKLPERLEATAEVRIIPPPRNGEDRPLADLLVAAPEAGG